MAQNYTAIDDLVKKFEELKYGAGTVAKESMPPPQSERIDHEAQTEKTDVPAQQPSQYVVKRQETIKLPESLKAAGVEATDEDAPGSSQIHFPITDEQIMKDLAASPRESRRWYATFFLYVLERAHFTLKRIGDRVVRVMKFS